MDESGSLHIPWQHLPPETLDNLVQSVLAAQVGDDNIDGLDWTAEQERLLAAVKRGEWLVVFDPDTESVTLVHQDDWKKTPSSAPGNTGDL